MEQGLLCRCSVCGREERAGDSPLTKGWPKCCDYTMTLIDTQAFIDSIDEQMGRAFAGVQVARRAASATGGSAATQK